MGRHRRAMVLRALATIAVAVLIGAVIWVDLTTAVWQDVVVLSGIAAGLLTFVLTALILEPVVARSEHRRWLPVTRLALTDILHALADEDRSQISRGHIHPRRLPVAAAFDSGAGAPASGPGTPGPASGGSTRLTPAVIEQTLTAVTMERELLTAVLARWAGFLAASADVRGLMDHLSALARHLDDIRDAALAAEDHGDPRHLRLVVGRYHDRLDAVIRETTTLLQRHDD